MDESQLICVQYYADPNQAELDATLLRSHGVECTVTGGSISNALSWFGLAVAKVELLTRADDAEKACQLLQDYSERSQAASYSRLNGISDPDWVCPACDESSASTFDECWSCGETRPENPERRPPDFEPQYVVMEESVEATASEDASPYRTPAMTSTRLRLNSRHELVRRATRSAVLSLAFPPLSVYSLYMIRKCIAEGPPPFRVYLAQLIALFGLLVTGAYSLLMLRSLLNL